MDRVKNPKTSYAMSRHWLVGIHDCVGTYQYSQKCLQRSATGNYKSGLCWQVAFVQNIRNYFLVFTWRIKTGLCRQETLTRRCPYAQVWLYIVWWIKCARIRQSNYHRYIIIPITFHRLIVSDIDIASFFHEYLLQPSTLQLSCLYWTCEINYRSIIDVLFA